VIHKNPAALQCQAGDTPVDGDTAIQRTRYPSSYKYFSLIEAFPTSHFICCSLSSAFCFEQPIVVCTLLATVPWDTTYLSVIVHIIVDRAVLSAVGQLT
jgi:hypothetical protein